MTSNGSGEAGENAGGSAGGQMSGSASGSSGETYRIQIGFYDKRDLSNLIGNGLIMRYENIDGTMRYSLGNFQSPEDAAEFIRIIRPMSFDDSFISKYNGGVRDMSFGLSRTIIFYD